MDFHSQYKTRNVLWLTGLLAASTVFSFVWLDHLNLSLWTQEHIPGDLKAAFHHLGAFGHAVGCLIAVLLIWNLDPARRGEIKLVLGSTLLAGVIASVMKVAVLRNRPFVSTVETGDLTLADSILSNAYQSFPSGHSATAFSLAFALSVLYPQGTKLFFVFAIITGVQRVVSSAHYPSDVFAGAGIGIMSSFVVLRFLQLQSERRTQRSLELLQPDMARQ